MENALSCGICMESYALDGDRCPRTLKECAHSFCTKCCAGLLKDGKIQCSVCRVFTDAPAGIDGLNKAFSILDVLQAGGAKSAAIITAAANNNNNNNSSPASSTLSTTTKAAAAAAPSSSSSSINISITSHVAGEELVDVLVELSPPSSGNLSRRSPVDICCVVDVSGSMGTEASLKNDQGKSETHGLSLLDVVKHSVKTIITVLSPEDRLSIVSYSSDATLVFPLRSMTPENQKSAIVALEKLQPDGMTNLWAGARVGMESLLGSARPGRVSSLFLLTDGQPNVEPAVGHIKALERHYATNSALRCSFHTFGFGYQVDSKLLVDMAKVGHGSYLFIPDSSFVGTAFINGVSNILTTIGQQATLKVTPLNGAKFASSDSDTPINIQLGELVVDIAKHYVVQLKVPKESKKVDFIEASLHYFATDGNGPEITLTTQGSTSEAGQQLLAHQWRQSIVELLEKSVAACSDKQVADSLATLKAARENVEKLAKRIETENVAKSAFGISLVQDLRGQVIEALSRKDWYTRWGVHYLISLARSHQLELCSNFKDPGLQSYAGALFSKLQATGDEAFCKLPPPAPAPPPPEVLAAVGGMANWRAQQASRPQVSMASYHVSSNPCFHGNAQVTLADGSTKRASALRRGDKLFVPSIAGRESSQARVECVVATKCIEGFADLVKLDTGLLVTPYHPVNIGGRWQFPCSIGKIDRFQCAEVVSFVLENNAPALLVDGIVGAALAHGLVDDGDVIAHPFFGTNRVIGSLSKLRGFDNGRVELRSGQCVVRDNVSGLICDLRQ